MKSISISKWVAAEKERRWVRSTSRSGQNTFTRFGWSIEHNCAPLLVLAVLWLSSLATFAQVNRTLGTLPPGGTVTITFDVTINTPFPAGTSSVTNQGSVSGTGFGPILTDDPATG